MGALVLQTYGRLHLVEVVTLDAGYCSLHNATLMDTTGYGSILGLTENQPERLREAQRLRQPLAAIQRPEAKVLGRDHGQWVRRSLWRMVECVGWLDWSHLRHVWLVRTEKFARQTTSRADIDRRSHRSVPCPATWDDVHIRRAQCQGKG